MRVLRAIRRFHPHGAPRRARASPQRNGRLLGLSPRTAPHRPRRASIAAQRWYVTALLAPMLVCFFVCLFVLFHFCSATFSVNNHLSLTTDYLIDWYLLLPVFFSSVGLRLQ